MALIDACSSSLARGGWDCAVAPGMKSSPASSTTPIAVVAGRRATLDIVFSLESTNLSARRVSLVGVSLCHSTCGHNRTLPIGDAWRRLGVLHLVPR